MLHNQHNNNVKNEISREVHIRLLCTQEIQSLQPTMSKALQMLTQEEQLPAPTNPPFIDERTIPNKCEDTFYSQKVGISTSIAMIFNSSFHPSDHIATVFGSFILSQVTITGVRMVDSSRKPVLTRSFSNEWNHVSQVNLASASFYFWNVKIFRRNKEKIKGENMGDYCSSGITAYLHNIKP